MPNQPANARPYRAVLFDLDNTLVDRDEALARIADALYDAQPGVRAALDRTAAVARFLELDDNGRAGRDRLMQRVLEEWPGIPARHAQMLDWYGALYGPSFRLDPSVGQMLRILNERGVPWGIVTNGSARQRKTIDAVGFDKLTSCLVISEEVGFRKPEPEIFLCALGLLGVEPGRDVLFGGDNPIADIGGAHDVGLSTAWVRRGRDWDESSFVPDRRIGHVSELSHLFG